MPSDASPRALERYGPFLRERLSEKRLLHSVSVADTARGMADAAGVDAERLYTAGLLHDAARELSNHDMVLAAIKYALPMDEITQEHPLLMHGPVAAALVRQELGVDDPEIHEAIYWHTTGHPGIGPLAQALIIADFSEPLRRYPEAAEVRDILRTQGFLPALRRTAEAKLESSKKKEKFHPESVRFRDWVDAGLPPVGPI